MCGRLCYDNTVELNHKQSIIALGPCLQVKGCFGKERDIRFLLYSNMRCLVVLASLLSFITAEDPIVNDNVPDVGQPGK